MKRILLALGIIASLAVGQIASATTYTFGDHAKAWPTWGTAAENGTDIIGTPQITGGSVDITSGILTDVAINATGLLTYPQMSSGDLFINILRNGSDTTWDYVVKSLGNTGGLVGIFDVRSAGITVANAGTSSYVMSNWPTAANIRDNQPVGITLANPISVGTATFSGLTSTGVSYDLGSGLDLEGFGDFILAWTVNCGNDVVYEKVPVPEPGTMVLLGAGLLGLVVFSKRRMSKQA